MKAVPSKALVAAIFALILGGSAMAQQEDPPFPDDIDRLLQGHVPSRSPRLAGQRSARASRREVEGELLSDEARRSRSARDVEQLDEHQMAAIRERTLAAFAKAKWQSMEPQDLERVESARDDAVLARIAHAKTADDGAIEWNGLPLLCGASTLLIGGFCWRRFRNA